MLPPNASDITDSQFRMDVQIKTPTNKITEFSDQSVNVTLLCFWKNLEKMLGYGNGWGRLILTFKVKLT